MAYLIDEELQLKNSCSALMLTEAVHPWSSQSEVITKSRKCMDMYYRYINLNHKESVHGGSRALQKDI